MRASPLRPSLALALSLFLPLLLSCGGDSGGGGGPPEPSSVTVTPGSDTLFAINATQAFTAEILDDAGHPVSGAVVTWSSSDTSVVTIGASSGIATARKNGSSQISAHVGDLSGSANAVVVQIVTSVTVTPGNAALTAVGDTLRFTAVAKDAGNTPVAGAQVLWSVNDNTVATIDTLGLATAKGPGMVLVSAQAQTRAGYAALGVTQAAMGVVFTSAPTVGKAGVVFTSAVQVEVRDSNGHRVRNASIPVTIGVQGGDGSFGMVGIKTLTTVDGAASFQNLGTTRAGALHLIASATGIDTAVSPTLNVAGGAPTQLKVVSFAAIQKSGDTLTATVAVADAFGNATDTSGVLIAPKLRREYAPGIFVEDGLEFIGPVATTGGTVSHWIARVTFAATGWYLVASAPGFDSVTAGPITIIPGPPTHTLLTYVSPYAQRQFVGVEAAKSDGLQAWITDEFGNVDPATPATFLTVTLNEWAYGTPADAQLTQEVGGVFSGTTTNGVLLLPGVKLRRPGVTDLRAVGGGFTPYGSEIEGRLFDKRGLSAGGKHACLMSGTMTYCWGDNSSSQLTGLGAMDSVARPVQGAPPFVALALGDSHSCGLTAAGAAWCWGKNSSGQLGRGTTTTSEATPQAVSGATTFRAIVAGGDHTCGIAVADSTAWCWGNNASGQLGDSTTTLRNVPTKVFGVVKFKQLAAGFDHTCGIAVGATGTAYCWGLNSSGQIGAGTTSPGTMKAPRAVVMDSVATIAAGDDFNCAEVRAPDGTLGVWCWGNSDQGRLGNGSQVTAAISTPILVAGLGSATLGGVVAGHVNACAIDADFNAYKCWGDNAYKQVNGQSPSPSYPAFFEAAGGANPGDDAVGGNFICRVASGNPGDYPALYCFGANDAGQLARGKTGVIFFGYDDRSVQ